MNRLRIFHIHIPQTGGTWLKHNLHLCLTDVNSFVRHDDWTVQGDGRIPASETHGVVPALFPEWEANNDLQPLPIAMAKQSDEALRFMNAFIGDIGHVGVTTLSKGGDGSGCGWWAPTDIRSKHKVAWDFKNSLKIGVVRNPYELLVSRYRKELHARKQQAKDSAVSFTEFLTAYFSDRTGSQELSIRANWAKDLYKQWYYPDGRCGIDVILRNESLQVALGTFLANYGYCTLEHAESCIEWQMRYRDATLNITANKANQPTPFDEEAHVTTRVMAPDGREENMQGDYYESELLHRPENEYDYREYYTEDLKKVVEDNCGWYLETFGYNFEGRSTKEEERLYGTEVCDCWFASAAPEMFAHSCRQRLQS